MALVQIPAGFFKKELQIYSNWREAFARELLQNALDAGAARIDITFTHDEASGHARVTFTDDGVGMTRDVLENVFFALGESTKTGTDSIGGFGRARIIICFAQTRYTIRTGNLLVEGQGSWYTITEVADYQRGCAFTIDLVDEDTDSVDGAFRSLLGTCALTIPVTIDGERARVARLPARATKVLRDEAGNPWARAYVSHGFGRTRVRVHGLTMFTRWPNSNDDVVLELVASRAREVLTASRDNLHGAFADQLDRFLADLSRNRRAALRPETPPLEERVGGGGFLRTDSYTEPTAVDAELDAQPAQVGEGHLVAVTPANDAAYDHVAAYSHRQLEMSLFDTGVVANPTPSGIDFDVYLLADTADARVRKLERAWNPLRWDARSGRRRRQVLMAWKTAVAEALDTLVRARPSVGSVLWTVGWTFDDEADHRKRDGGHIIALNPVDADGRTRYKVSERSARARLLALALHEVAHVVVADHDEQFANLLTVLVASFDFPAADRRLQTAIRRA